VLINKRRDDDNIQLASAVSLFCSASRCRNPAATLNRCIFSNNNPIVLIFGGKLLRE